MKFTFSGFILGLVLPAVVLASPSRVGVLVTGQSHKLDDPDFESFKSQYIQRSVQLRTLGSVRAEDIRRGRQLKFEQRRLIEEFFSSEMRRSPSQSLLSLSAPVQGSLLAQMENETRALRGLKPEQGAQSARVLLLGDSRNGFAVTILFLNKEISRVLGEAGRMGDRRVIFSDSETEMLCQILDRAFGLEWVRGGSVIQGADNGATVFSGV